MEKEEIEKLAESLMPYDQSNKHNGPIHWEKHRNKIDKYRNAFIKGYLACQETNQWVSVETALPKHNQEVLFWTFYKNQSVETNMKKGVFLNPDQWGRIRFCDGAFHGLHEVTHWQLLPSPPKTSTPNLKN